VSALDRYSVLIPET